MIVPMLEAISAMLEQSKETEVQAYLVRAACAKVMLDKVIEGMQSKETRIIPPDFVVPEKKEKQNKKEGEIQVVVEHGKITNVLHAKEDTQLELDGKIYPWQECIGKSFSTGRVI